MVWLRVVLSGFVVSMLVAVAPHLEPQMTYRETMEEYYQESPYTYYGFATRYGPDDLAIDELYWSAQEAADQMERGYMLLGGGYGYVDGYLLENRAGAGYPLMADRGDQKLNRAQRNLLLFSSLSRDELSAITSITYVGIVSLHSPNDIGREFCLLSMDGEHIGTVVVGGTAARNDLTYWGPSLNDYYQHARIGVRQLIRDGVEYRWAADLSDDAYYRLGGDGGAVFIILAPPYVCWNEVSVDIRPQPE